MAAVDDYLAVRPEAEPRLRRLAAAGRIAVGPWYVLPDEFLVSGETLVRNLQMGLERAAAFGGAMEVGYLPDMFGHVAQMPQLLRQAGFDHAVVWRGVPAAVDRTAFWWRAPDGSGVRAEYLPVGYGNGAAVPDDAKALVERIRAHEAELGGAPARRRAPAVDERRRPPAAPAPPRAGWWPRPTSSPTTTASRSRRWPQYLAGGVGRRPAHVDGRAAVGRDGPTCSWAWRPTGSTSSRPRPGPSGPSSGWPSRCPPSSSSADALAGGGAAAGVDRGRAQRGPRLGLRLLRRRGGRRRARPLRRGHPDRRGAHRPGPRRPGRRRWRSPGPVVVNPSARTRSGLVELVLPGTGEVEGGQVVGGPAGLGHRAGGPRRPARHRPRPGRQRRGGVGRRHRRRRRVRRRVRASTWSLRTGPRPAAPRPRPGLDPRRPLRPGRRPPARPVHVRIEHEPYRRVLVRADDVPGFGWTAWSPADPPSPVAPVTAARDAADGCTLANGLVTVAVDPTDGTFSLDGLTGLDLLVDDGDAGDTYNYSPPDGDIAVDAPDRR